MAATRSRCLAFSLLAWASLTAPAASGAESAGEAIGTPFELSPEHPPGTEYMGIRLLGALRLDGVDVGGRYRLSGLSALGFDADADRLYALSDRGILFHLALDIDAGTLVGARALAAYALRDARGRPLTGSLADAEGLALRRASNGVAGDTAVVVSFERHPRIVVFDVEGRPTGAVALPARLRDRSAYRTGNRGLEALADHPRHGLVVGPEQPLDGIQGWVEIFGIESGLAWRYPLPLEPNHALVDLVALPDGALLALERAHGPIMFVPFITILRRLPALPDGGGALAAVPPVARLSTGQGFALDNFEGLARLDERRFVMVSDDNAQTYQSTLLVHFELLEPGRDSGPVAPSGAVKR